MTEPAGEPRRATLFLLSPADVGGKRARLLLEGRGDAALARRVATTGASLGEVFTFLSSLYFRGKLAYARRFASSPADDVRIITTNRGLLPADTTVTAADLTSFGSTEIDEDHPTYRTSLERDARALPHVRVVLLGSLATGKYLSILTAILGDRLHYPRGFPRLGDMSRGSVLLKAVQAGQELEYDPASLLTIPARPARRAREPDRVTTRDAEETSSTD